MKYFVSSEEYDGGARLHLDGLFFAAPPSGLGGRAHIVRAGDSVTLQDMTLFPGHLTHKEAIVWGVRGVLRLGPIRRLWIRRFLRRPWKRSTISDATRIWEAPRRVRYGQDGEV